MRGKTIVAFAFLAFVANTIGRAADPPPPAAVQISAKADSDQPASWPLVVEITLTNSGTKAISWWCGGPDEYPGAEHFLVEVRDGPKIDWHVVAATNGQYVEGSGTGRQLKPGESIVVPLAFAVSKTDIVFFRIKPRDWPAAAPAEGAIRVRGDSRCVDARRARVIACVLTQSPPFWQHLAEHYADSVVIDAMLKLVTIDNAPIVTGAAKVLARQKTLPTSASDSFAMLINRWLPRAPRTEWSGLREWIAEAALKTEGESARQAMLQLMAETKDSNTRWVAMNALRLSPGDEAWLRRARESIIALSALEKDDGDFARRQKLATEWLDARIKHPQ